MKFTLILFIALIYLTSTSHAENPPLDCTNINTFSKSRDCAAQRLATAEKQMAVHYEYIRSLLAEQSIMPLDGVQDNSVEFIASQKAWFIYRDQTCAAEGLMHWGTSLEFSMADLCLERVTHARIDELDQMSHMSH